MKKIGKGKIVRFKGEKTPRLVRVGNKNYWNVNRGKGYGRKVGKPVIAQKYRFTRRKTGKRYV